MNSATTMAIRIDRHGGPETMLWREIPLDPPGPGEARVRHTAIGVNFSDINVRRGGFYPNHAPSLPLGLGNEAAGVTGHIQDREAFRKEAGALFDLVRQGVLSAHVHRTYALKDAAEAHRDIEASSVAGSVVLLP